jgi:hypothetical protein
MKKLVFVLVAITVVACGLVALFRKDIEAVTGQSVKPQSPAVAAVEATSPNDSHMVSSVDSSAAANASAIRQVPKSVEIPFERRLLIGSSLDVAAIEGLLRSKQYDAQLDAFASQSAADADAAALSSAYNELLKQQISENQIKADLVRMICGVTTCVGVLRNGSEAEYDRWTDVFFRDSKVKGYGLTSMTATGADGKPEHRFVFSTDPAANSVTAPLR